MPQDRKITFEPKNEQQRPADSVRQGERYNFYFNAEGEGASALTGTFSVVQFFTDTPTITGSLTYVDCKYKGTLTAANTASLSAGTQYFIYAEFTDSDEDIHVPVKIYITAGRG